MRGGKWKFLIIWGRIPTPCADWGDILPSHADKGASGTCQCWRESVQQVAPARRKPYFSPMSKFNTGNLPLRGILHVIRSKNGWHFLWWARRALPPCKVSGDRTTHAGCRFENMVFLCLLSAVYREVANCRYQNTYSQAKNQVFHPSWAYRCTNLRQAWHQKWRKHAKPNSSFLSLIRFSQIWSGRAWKLSIPFAAKFSWIGSVILEPLWCASPCSIAMISSTWGHYGVKQEAQLTLTKLRPV